ncbi:MAG: AEC family transporter [Pseudomonadota bacterium]
MYLETLSTTVLVTGPIFLIVLLGLVLRRLGFIDDRFNDVAARLVFSICLPALLFSAISRIDIQETVRPGLFYYSLAATLLAFSVAWLMVLPLQPRADRGVYVQGAFRGNLGVVGIALCAAAYGPEGLAVASVLMAGMTVLYNVLGVFILSVYANRTLDLRGVIVKTLQNPLIIAIAIAVTLSALDVHIPSVLLATGDYLGSMALPLALLGTGASMSLSGLRRAGVATLSVVTMKAAVLPGLCTVLAAMLGFKGMELGVLFLMFVSPTATASYPMVRAMGANAALAANIIMLSTLTCLFTCSLGIFVLSATDWG